MKASVSHSRRTQVADAKSGEVSLRILLVNFHAKRAAERDHVLADFYSGKSFSMFDTFAADYALLVEILFFRYHGSIQLWRFFCRE